MNRSISLLLTLMAGFATACDAVHDDMNGDETVQATFEAYDDSAVTIVSAANSHHEHMMSLAADDGLAEAELDHQARMRTMMERFDAARGDLETCAMRMDMMDDTRMPHDMGDMNTAADAIRTELAHHDEMMGEAADAAAVEAEENRHLALMKIKFEALAAHRMAMAGVMLGHSSGGCMMPGQAAR